MVDLVIYVPRSAAAFEQVQRQLLFQQTQQPQQQQRATPASNSSTTLTTTFVCANAHASRCIWRDLKPCLMDPHTNPLTVVKLWTCLLPAFPQSPKRQHKSVASYTKGADPSLMLFFSSKPLHLPCDDKTWQELVDVQKWHNLPKLSSANQHLESLSGNSRNTTVSCWILPPLGTRLEYAWEQRVIHWEHVLIQAQSLAGWYSTLGGGYFMTHHASTAILLARQQQQMAAILGDTTMILKCTINMAYDCIACGHFRFARTLLRQVEVALDQRGHKSIKDAAILRNMCRAARLFAKRVQQWARKQQDNAHQGKYKGLRDDFYRIRIVTDRSSVHDIPQSFRNAMAT